MVAFQAAPVMRIEATNDSHQRPQRDMPSLGGLGFAPFGPWTPMNGLASADLAISAALAIGHSPLSGGLELMLRLASLCEFICQPVRVGDLEIVLYHPGRR